MKAKGNQTFIEFSANISEILNDRGNPRRPEGYYPWSAWRIEAEILNLLAGRNYCGLAGSPRYADHIVGYHMSGYHDPGYSAEEYFRCVFDHITTNKKKLEDPPTTRLQDYIRSHCLDPDKQHEPNLSPVSLWQIIARAGETEGSAHNPPCYRYFEGEDCHRLKICLYDVLSNSNRLYGELYRLGLYPPQYINDIKPMQARQLNKLIKRARERAGESGKWQQHLPAVWAETPLKKIGDNKIRDYASFAEHDLIKRLLGLRYAQNQYLPYDEQPVEENDEYLTPDDVLETLAESDHEAEYLAEIALLAERLNTAALTPRDRALLFAIVHQRDFSHLIAEDEDEDALFAHLGEQLRQLQRAHNSEEK